MAGLNVIEPNLMKNVFSRLIKTQQILANRFMRESIVAVSKLNTKYAVKLITASYCLSAVEANDNNQTDPNWQSHSKDKLSTGEIVGIVYGFLTTLVAVLTFYYAHIKNKDPTYWNEEQADWVIKNFGLKESDRDELENLKNMVNEAQKLIESMLENDQQNQTLEEKISKLEEKGKEV